MYGNKDCPDCKICLIGESGVGKTSIINRYISNTFNSEEESSNAGQYYQKKISLKDLGSINLDIWDTAGKEKFRSLTKFFYKDAPVLILVYDISRRASFEEVKKYWIPNIKENATPNASKFIHIKKYLLMN